MIFEWKKISVSLMTAGTAIMLAGCALLPQEEVFSPAPVIEAYDVAEYKQIPVQRGDLKSIANVNCKYMPAKKDVLSFPVDGEYIQDIYVSEGQFVKAGDLLAQIEMGNLEDEIAAVLHEMEVLRVKSAHVSENLALEQRLNEVRYEKGTEQYEAHKAVTQENHRLQLEGYQDETYLLELRYRELLQKKSDRQIVAKFDGTITYAAKMVDGLLSTKDKNMVTVADMNTTAFTVTGDNAVYFPVGTKVTVTIGEKHYETESVEPDILGVTETPKDETAYLLLYEPDPALESGDNGKIEVILDSREDVLYLDIDAVKTANGRQFVYVLNEDGLRVMQDVTTGLQVGHSVEITSGLEEGDSVVIY